MKSSLVDEYSTSQSVQQAFSIIKGTDISQTVDNIDPFFLWIANFKKNLIEQETDSGYYKLKNSPNYIVSDIRVTTRRMKMKNNDMLKGVKQWVSTELAPFEDPFNGLIESTEPFSLV